MNYYFKNSAVSFLFLSTFLIASIAIADITVGTSTTGLSSDVAYSTVTVIKPDAAPGDILLASIAVNGGQGANITSPSGWTLIGRTDNSSNVSLATYWKKVEASEPSSYTWIIAPQNRATGGITMFSGVDVSSPIDTFASSTGRGTAAVAPGINTTAKGDDVVALFAADVGAKNTGYFATSTGFTKRFDIKNTPYGPTAMAEDMVQAIAGIIGSVSSQFSSSQHDWAAQTVALRMANTGSLNNGLVAYWSMDGDSTDRTGNGHNGSDVSVTYAPGLINQSGVYGTAPSVTTIADDPNLDFNVGLTVAGWIKPQDFADNASENLAVKTNSSDWGSGNGGQWYLRLNNLTTIEGGIKMNGIQNGIGNNSLSLATGSWVFIVMTYDGSNMKLYVNGNEVSSVPKTGTIDTGSYPLYIGNNGLAGEYITHSVDEVGLWSRALSATEINQLYNNGTGRQYPF